MESHFQNVIKEMVSTIPSGQIDPRQGAIKSAVLAYLSANGVNKPNLQKRIQRSKLYHCLSVNAVPSATFFQGAFVPENTNFPNNTFTIPEDEPKIIHGIWVETGVSAVISQTNWALGANDASIKNATLTISSNGTNVVKELPLADALAGLTDRGLGFIPLDCPFLLKGQESLTATVTFKNPYAVLNTNMRISLEAIGLIS